MSGSSDLATDDAKWQDVAEESQPGSTSKAPGPSLYPLGAQSSVGSASSAPVKHPKPPPEAPPKHLLTSSKGGGKAGKGEAAKANRKAKGKGGGSSAAGVDDDDEESDYQADTPVARDLMSGPNAPMQGHSGTVGGLLRPLTLK